MVISYAKTAGKYKYPFLITFGLLTILYGVFRGSYLYWDVNLYLLVYTKIYEFYHNTDTSINKERVISSAVISFTLLIIGIIYQYLYHSPTATSATTSNDNTSSSSSTSSTTTYRNSSSRRVTSQ
jgi:hypothetical protein